MWAMNAVGNAVSNAVGNGGRVCGLYLLFGGLPSCFGHAGRACEASPGAACVRAMCANRSPAATEAVALFDVEHGTTPQRACGDAGMAVARRDARPPMGGPRGCERVWAHSAREGRMCTGSCLSALWTRWISPCHEQAWPMCECVCARVCPSVVNEG